MIYEGQFESVDLDNVVMVKNLLHYFISTY